MIGTSLGRKRDALRHHALFRSLTAAEIEDVVAHASERRVPRGGLIFGKGDAGSSMMAVLTGQVRISTMSADGREVTLNLIGPGDVLGELALLDGKPRSASATAVSDTLLMVVERGHFLPLLRRHEGLAERLLVLLCERLRQTSVTLEDVALTTLPARLARVLVRLAEQRGRPDVTGGIRIEAGTSQRELANQVASSRESVNKQLRAWREAGVLSVEGRAIVLHRPPALRRLFD